MAETKDHEESFTVSLVTAPPPPPTPDKPTLQAPSIVFVNKPFIVTGTTPDPNQTVWIEIDKLLIDEEIARGVSDSEHKFEIEVVLTKIGSEKIHAEVAGIGLNPVSPSVTIIVVDWWIIFALGLLIVFFLYKQGAFKKLMKKKKRRKK